MQVLPAFIVKEMCQDLLICKPFDADLMEEFDNVLKAYIPKSPPKDRHTSSANANASFTLKNIQVCLSKLFQL